MSTRKKSKTKLVKSKTKGLNMNSTTDILGNKGG